MANKGVNLYRKWRGTLITSLIFDVDGTILDTEKAILKSLQRILKEELNKDYTLDALEFALGIPGKEALKN